MSKIVSYINLIFLLTCFLLLNTVQSALIANHTCYQCLKVGDKFCYDGANQKCCDNSDLDQVCTKTCITPYGGPPMSIKDNYNITHPRSIEQDYYLNLFKCQRVQANPCVSNDQLIIPMIDHFRSYPFFEEQSDFCFYQSNITKKNEQTLDFQVRYLNNTPDYFAYVWYSNDWNNLTNIVGAYALNETAVNKQDGFRVANQMMLYLVLWKNNTSRTAYQAHCSIQLMLKDASNYSPEEPVDQEAPILVIIIAVSVGGLISAFCIGIIIYMVVKAVRKRKELEVRDNEDRQQVLRDSPGPEDADEDSRITKKKKKKEKTRGESGDHGIDVEQLDEYINDKGANDKMIKVQPQMDTQTKKRKNTRSKTQKQNKDLFEVQEDDMQKYKQSKTKDKLRDPDDLGSIITKNINQRPQSSQVKVKRAGSKTGSLFSDKFTGSQYGGSNSQFNNNNINHQKSISLNASDQEKSSSHRDDRITTSGNLDVQTNEGLGTVKTRFFGLQVDHQIEEEVEDKEGDDNMHFANQMQDVQEYSHIQYNDQALHQFHNNIIQPLEQQEDYNYSSNVSMYHTVKEDKKMKQSLLEPRVNAFMEPQTVSRKKTIKKVEQQELQIDDDDILGGNSIHQQIIEEQAQTQEQPQAEIPEQDEQQIMKNQFYQNQNQESEDYGYESIEQIDEIN